MLPTDLVHLSLQARVGVQVVVLGDTTAVSEDLGALCILLGRDITEFLEQGHIDVRLDVASDSGVAIPVPGPADIGGLIDQPDVVDAELFAPDADQ